jgi:tetratricopeptide (TPR) repeat protein
MRRSWRAFAAIGLFGLWPVVGCHQVPGDRSVHDLKPIQQKAGSAPRQELTAIDIVQTAIAKAEALEKAGKTEEAIAAYEKMREPGSPNAMQASKKLATLHLRDNRLDQAEQECQLVLQKNPNDADALCNLGDASYRRGHFGIADKYLQLAVKNRNDFPQAWASLGMTLAQKAEYAESIEAFKHVVSHAEAYCEVAFVMKLQGKRDEAIKAYQRALALDPTSQRAQLELLRLEKAALIDPPTKVTLTTPFAPGKAATVELEEAVPIKMTSMERRMPDRITLPPLPSVMLPQTDELKK